MTKQLLLVTCFFVIVGTIRFTMVKPSQAKYKEMHQKVDLQQVDLDENWPFPKTLSSVDPRLDALLKLQ